MTTCEGNEEHKPIEIASQSNGDASSKSSPSESGFAQQNPVGSQKCVVTYQHCLSQINVQLSSKNLAGVGSQSVKL